MIKPKLFIAAFAAVLFFVKANAQQDTTHFDLGHLQLKKEFTQSITIKGSDLEKMPFSSLADAINVWFYGAYSNTNTLVYIIDGNLAGDVNAYSIYDIDEVTLIQNSVSKLAGATGPQQLVLIKTKRAKTKGLEVTAAGQANLNSFYTNNPATGGTSDKSKTSVYQQYYVSAHENTGNMQYGVSADATWDALPEFKDPSVDYGTPQNIRRIKLNGFFSVKLGSSVLDVTAGYVPQKKAEAYAVNDTTSQTAVDLEENSRMWNGTVKLTTTILPGLVNVVHGDYNNYRDNETGVNLSQYSGESTTELFRAEAYGHNIVAYDNLSYDAKIGDWGLAPAVNLTFRTFRDSDYTATSTQANGGVQSATTSWQRTNEHSFLLTPSVNLYYKSYFNIQGGLLYNLASIGAYSLPGGTKVKKALPFVSASADVMQLLDPAGSVSVKVYGSYAVTAFLYDNANMLSPLNETTPTIPLVRQVGTPLPYGGPLYTYYPGYSFYSSQANAGKTFRDFAAGITVSPKQTGLTLGYFFQHTNYLSPIYIEVPFGGNFENPEIIYENAGATLNRLSLGYDLVNSSAFKWESSVNATMIKTNLPVSLSSPIILGNNEWTGGWTNRLTYRDFSAGVDALYQFGEKVQTATFAPTYAVNTSTINSFSLQNLYVGYHLKVKGVHALEVFANGRNLFQNKKEDITDDRKYFGLGFRATL